VKEWFQTYYGPANAVLVIAGDVDPKVAREKVEHYFGDIPSGPPVGRQDAWIAKRTGSQRGVLQDRVPQARLYRVWNVPGWGSADGEYLGLLGRVLSAGKTSRLYKRLVYDDQIATDVAAYVDTREIGGLFVIQATARPGDDLTKVERAVNEEMARLLRTGPTPAELARVKTDFRADLIRGIERIGGFGGKSDVLAQGAVFTGRPDLYKVRLQRVASATTVDLQRVAKQWLADGDYTLEVRPFPNYQTATAGADRSKVPEPGAPPAAKFPDLERATLSNGLKIVLAERPSVPQVRFDLLLDAGFAADQSAEPGTANMTLAMLDEGTQRRTSLQISEELQRLGASLSAFSRLDYSSVTLDALKENLDPSLALFSDVVLNPSFPQRDFDRLKKQQLAAIEREKAEPFTMALRAFPELVYPTGHAYATPWSGTGTEESAAKITRADVAAFHRAWFKPNHATLIVVGATTMGEIRPKLERLFAAWKPGDIPAKNVKDVAPPATPAVYLIDRPGALQTVILAGNLAPPKNNPNEVPIEVMDALLGGNFGSRINMNLREDKHWSYGAGSFIRDARGQRPFVAYAPVQTDKTKESLVELAKELQGILKDRPVDSTELAQAKSSLTLTLPGEWETMAAVDATIRSIVTFGLDDRYFDTYPTKVRAVDSAQVPAAAAQVVHPNRLVWLIVGDRAKIEAGVRELNLGEVKIIQPT
jgi:zinc protease